MDSYKHEEHKKKLANEVFLDCSIPESPLENSKASKTEAFLLRPAQPPSTATSSDTQQESLLSYHPSQQFDAKLNTTVDEIISRIDEVNSEHNKPDGIKGFYTSSEEEGSPKKIKCDLTMSQTTRMINNYDFSQEMKQEEEKENSRKSVRKSASRKNARKSRAEVTENRTGLESNNVRKKRIDSLVINNKTKESRTLKSPSSGSKPPNDSGIIVNIKSHRSSQSPSTSEIKVNPVDNIPPKKGNHPTTSSSPLPVPRKSCRMKKKSSLFNIGEIGAILKPARNSVSTAEAANKNHTLEQSSNIAPLQPPASIIAASQESSEEPTSLAGNGSSNPRIHSKRTNKKKSGNSNDNTSLNLSSSPELLNSRLHESTPQTNSSVVGTPRRRSARLLNIKEAVDNTPPVLATISSRNNNKRHRRDRNLNTSRSSASKKSRTSLDDFALSATGESSQSQSRKKVCSFHNFYDHQFLHILSS